MLPMIGTAVASAKMTMNAIARAIQIHGAAAKYRQPALHQLTPLPAALGAAARTASADGPELGAMGSTIGRPRAIRSKGIYGSTAVENARPGGCKPRA